MNRVNSKKNQAGFSLVVAIFIMVILGLMGTFMLSTSIVQRKTTDYAIQGARAYKAAQSGMQWGIQRVLYVNRAAVCGNNAITGATSTLSFTQAGLNGFDADVTCSWTEHVDQGINFCMYRFRVEASFGSFGELDFVSRTIEGLITNRSISVATGAEPGC